MHSSGKYHTYHPLYFMSDIISVVIHVGSVLIYSCSSPPVWHKASIMFLHLLQSVAEYASPYETPISSSSASAVLCQMPLRRPCFILPSGVHLRATLGISSEGIQDVSKPFQMTMCNLIYHVSASSLSVEHGFHTRSLWDNILWPHT